MNTRGSGFYLRGLHLRINYFKCSDAFKMSSRVSIFIHEDSNLQNNYFDDYNFKDK
jgi:hypothetical protein